jgi:hypothetical protein
MVWALVWWAHTSNPADEEAGQLGRGCSRIEQECAGQQAPAATLGWDPSGSVSLNPLVLPLPSHGPPPSHWQLNQWPLQSVSIEAHSLTVPALTSLLAAVLGAFKRAHQPVSS